MSEGILHLKWQDMCSNLQYPFRSLRSDVDFSDVALVTKEGELFAHKVVLSTGSPFFRELLRKNHFRVSGFSSGPISIVYLVGVSRQNLSLVLDFMYQGEVSLQEKDLETFLDLAEELQITGLTQRSSPAAAAGSSSRCQAPLVTIKQEVQARQSGHGFLRRQASPVAPGGPEAMEEFGCSSAHQAGIDQPEWRSHNERGPFEGEEEVNGECSSSRPPPNRSKFIAVRAPTEPAPRRQTPTQPEEDGLATASEDSVPVEDDNYPEWTEKDDTDLFHQGEEEEDDGEEGHPEDEESAGRAYKDVRDTMIARINKDEYVCRKCDKLFKSRSSVMNHVEMKHLDLPRVECLLCNKVLKTKHHHRFHIYSCHRIRGRKILESYGRILDKSSLTR